MHGLNEKLRDPQATDEVIAKWENLKTKVQTAKDILGFSARKHQDLFRDNRIEIEELLQERRKLIA